jgi:hypothetical protein
MKVHNSIRIKTVQCDNEIKKHSQVAEFLVSKSIRIEPSAPNTQDQNGGAERSGGVLKDKKYRFIYLDLQTIACVLYRAHQIASHVLVST